MSTQRKPQGRSGKLPLGTFVEAELYAEVAALAEREQRSLAQIVRRALRRELERHDERQAA